MLTITFDIIIKLYYLNKDISSIINQIYYQNKSLYELYQITDNNTNIHKNSKRKYNLFDFTDIIIRGKTSNFKYENWFFFNGFENICNRFGRLLKHKRNNALSDNMIDKKFYFYQYYFRLI